MSSNPRSPKDRFADRFNDTAPLQPIDSRDSQLSYASGGGIRSQGHSQAPSQAHSVSIYSHDSAPPSDQHSRRQVRVSRNPSGSSRVLPYTSTPPKQVSTSDGSRYRHNDSAASGFDGIQTGAQSPRKPATDSAYEMSAVRSSSTQQQHSDDTVGAHQDHHDNTQPEEDAFRGHPYTHRRPNYSTHASSQLESVVLDTVDETVNESFQRNEAKAVLSPLPAMPYQLSSQSTVALSSAMTKTGSSGSEATTKEQFRSETPTQCVTNEADHPSPWVHCKHFAPDFQKLGWHRYPFAIVDYGAAQAGLPLIPMTYKPGPAPVELRAIWAFAGMVFLNCLGFILVLPWILIFTFLFLGLALASLPTLFLPLSIGRDLAPKLWKPFEYIFAGGAIFGFGVAYTALWIVYTTLFVVFWPFNAIFSLPCSQRFAKKVIARLSRLRWPTTGYRTRSSWVDAYFNRQPSSTDIVSMAVDMFNNAWFFLLAWPMDIALRLTFTFLAMPQYTPLLLYLYIPGWAALSIFIMRKFKNWIAFNFVKNVCQQAAPSIFHKQPETPTESKAERDGAECDPGPSSINNSVYVLRPSHTVNGNHQVINLDTRNGCNDGYNSALSQHPQSRGMYGHFSGDIMTPYGNGDLSTSTFFKQDGSMDRSLLTPGTERSRSPHMNMLTSVPYDSRFTIGSDGTGSPVRKTRNTRGGDPGTSARQRGAYDNGSPNVTLNLDRVVTRNDGGSISGEFQEVSPEQRKSSRPSRSRGTSTAGAQQLGRAMTRGAQQQSERLRASPPQHQGYHHLAGERPDMRRMPSSDADESFETANGFSGAANARTIRFIHANNQGFYQ